MGLFLQSGYVELIILAVTVLVVAYMKFKKRNDNLSQLPSVTIYEGIMHNLDLFLGVTQIGVLHKQLYKRYKRNKITLVSKALKLVLVTDPDYVNKILVTDFSSFHDRGFKSDFETNPLDGNLFSLEGERWKVLRNKLSPTFTSGKLKGMFPLMVKCCDELVESIKLGKDEDEVEIMDRLACFTTDVIGSCAFGLDVSSIKDPTNEFRVMGRRIFRPRLQELIIRFLMAMNPSFTSFFKLRTIPKDINDFFTNLVKQSFDMRLKSGVKRNDFLQLLLELREKGSIDLDQTENDEDDVQELSYSSEGTKYELTDEVLTAQAFVFFAAGFETSATSMGYTLYMLAKNPNEQEIAREEVRAIKEKHGSISYAAVKEMKYLNACLLETIRLFPPISVLFRQSTKVHTFPNGTTLDKGTLIAIPVSGLHDDPDFFESPELFRPDRFVDRTPPNGTFLPFGDGPRICIGQRFALAEAIMGLAKILDNFKVTLGSKTKEPVEVNPGSFVTLPKYGIWLKLEKLEKKVIFY